jgi:hypothetical protein
MSSDNGTRWGSKALLVILAALCAGGAWYGTTLQTNAASKARAAAEERAVGYVHDQLAPAMKGWNPGDQTKKLADAVNSGILGDTHVSAVRVWTVEGALIFSTVDGDNGTVDATSFAALASGDTVALQDDSATTLRTFAPAGGSIGEVQQDAAAIDAAAKLPWKVLQLALLGVALILFVAAFFAGNAPRTKTEKPAKAKRGARTEDDRAVAEEPSRSSRGDADVDPELVKLHQRTQKAEASRRAMEDQLNVLRSQLQSGDAGSVSRISDLEGSLQDAHGRVVAAEEKHVALQSRIAELEAAAAATGPPEARLAALEEELRDAKTAAAEIQGQFSQLEMRAVQAETAGAAHAGQLEEAHVKARQAELQVQVVVDRAMAAERQVAELQAATAELQSHAAAGPSNGHGTEQQLRELHEQLAAAGSKTVELEAAAREATARAAAAEELLAAAEARAAHAEALAGDGDSSARARVQELERELREARAQATAASRFVDHVLESTAAPEAPSASAASAAPSARVASAPAAPAAHEAPPVVPPAEAPAARETAKPPVPAELDEDSRVRAELERIGEMLDQSHEAGDVNGLRSRLAKTAARKKGRTVDPATRSS